MTTKSGGGLACLTVGAAHPQPSPQAHPRRGCPASVLPAPDGARGRGLLRWTRTRPGESASRCSAGRSVGDPSCTDFRTRLLGSPAPGEVESGLDAEVFKARNVLSLSTTEEPRLPNVREGLPRGSRGARWQ